MQAYRGRGVHQRAAACSRAVSEWARRKRAAAALGLKTLPVNICRRFVEAADALSRALLFAPPLCAHTTELLSPGGDEACGDPQRERERGGLRTRRVYRGKHRLPSSLPVCALFTRLSARLPTPPSSALLLLLLLLTPRRFPRRGSLTMSFPIRERTMTSYKVQAFFPLYLRHSQPTAAHKTAASDILSAARAGRTSRARLLSPSLSLSLSLS